MAKVADRVREIVAEILLRETVEDGATLRDMGADSLDVVEVVLGCEESFGIEIPDEVAEELELWSVARLITYCEGRVSRAAVVKGEEAGS